MSILLLLYYVSSGFAPEPNTSDTLYSHMDNARILMTDENAYCEVVGHGGFSAAGTASDVRNSSLSAAVQRLESDSGLRLIERTTVICA